MNQKDILKERGIVISLCDYTGNFVRPWADAGYECYCVDLRHSIRSVKKEGNINFLYGDCRAWLPPEHTKIAFMAAFPPCTHVTCGGARDFITKGAALLADAISLFTLCELACRYSRAPYFIENPVGVLSSHIHKPDYIFNPCDYAGYLVNSLNEQYSKATCL